LNIVRRDSLSIDRRVYIRRAGNGQLHPSREAPNHAPSSRLRVEADHISCRIAEPCNDLRRIRGDGLHESPPLATMVSRVAATLSRPDFAPGGRPSTQVPLTSPVESSRGAAIAAFPDVPAEDPFEEVGRTRNVGSGHLYIADFSVGKRGRHRSSPRDVMILTAIGNMQQSRFQKETPCGLVGPPGFEPGTNRL
jgi:hypothetical protein